MRIFGCQLIMFTFGLIGLCQCGRSNKNENLKVDSIIVDERRDSDSKSLEKTSKDSLISLVSFTDIPPEIEGCSCYFSESEEQHSRNEYLFIADFDSTAFISIDNKLLKLRLVSTGREPMSFGDYDHTDIYIADNYKITLNIKYKDSPREEGDEVWLNTGTIAIEGKNGHKRIIKFFGSCGC